jgi:hypothetical protein
LKRVPANIIHKNRKIQFSILNIIHDLIMLFCCSLDKDIVDDIKTKCDKKCNAVEFKYDNFNYFLSSDTLVIDSNEVGDSNYYFMYDGKIDNCKELCKKYKIDTLLNHECEIFLKIYQKYDAQIEWNDENYWNRFSWRHEIKGKYSFVLVDIKKHHIIFGRNSVSIPLFECVDNAGNIIVSSNQFVEKDYNIQISKITGYIAEYQFQKGLLKELKIHNAEVGIFDYDHIDKFYNPRCNYYKHLWERHPAEGFGAIIHMLEHK